jgi:hypothetical protein
MHVTWPDGSESVITAGGAWQKTHGGKKLVKPHRQYRDALRQVTRKFVKKACKIEPKTSKTGPKGLGNLMVIFSLIEIYDVLNRAAETGESPAVIYLEDMGIGADDLET